MRTLLVNFRTSKIDPKSDFRHFDRLRFQTKNRPKVCTAYDLAKNRGILPRFFAAKSVILQIIGNIDEKWRFFVEKSSENL